MTDHQERPEPAVRTPAPGDLGVVQAFVNTVDLEGGEEELPDPQALAAWLTERGLLDGPGPLSEGDLRLMRSFREVLRELALGNHDGAPSPASVETLNRMAAAARLRVRFDGGGGARLEPDAPGIDGAIGRLLAIVYAAIEDGTWRRLKACRSDTCRWVFYDRSRNRSSSWCTMAVCGNRRKARAYRRRRREAS